LDFLCYFRENSIQHHSWARILSDPAHDGFGPAHKWQPQPSDQRTAHTGHLVRIFPIVPISIPPPTGGGGARRRDVGDDSSGALLARGGDDLHWLLQHLRRAGAELPQGALQVRGRVPREGPLLRL
jgi:hypothetical protein